MLKNNELKMLGIMSMAGISYDYPLLQTLLKVKRLANKHLKYSVYQCNGEGWLKGVKIRNDEDKWYTDREQGNDVFDLEIAKIEEKIEALLPDNIRVEYRGDPRGQTVCLYNGDKFIYFMD